MSQPTIKYSLRNAIGAIAVISVLLALCRYFGTAAGTALIVLTLVYVLCTRLEQGTLLWLLACSLFITCLCALDSAPRSLAELAILPFHLAARG